MPDSELDRVAERLETACCRHCREWVDVRGRVPFTPVACRRCGAEQPAPVRFGPYLLLDVLGRGGMGVVYRALDDALHREVAIKVMRDEFSRDGCHREGFQREARAAAALNHPNVVQVYVFGEHQGLWYLVMELVDGGSLDDCVEAGQPLPELRLVAVAREAAAGLRAAQEAGLVHGDIKPANILFTRKGAAKLADFGLANLARRQQDPTGQVWGTPYYIPPERVRRKPSDHRSDIYSLGATLFHVGTGRPPFTGATPREVVTARLQAPAPDPREVRPDLTPATSSVLRRMLADPPGRRYPTYASLLADLDKARIAAEQAAAERRARAEAAPVRPWRQGLSLASSLLIAGLAGGVYVGWRGAGRADADGVEIAFHEVDPATGARRAVTVEEAAARDAEARRARWAEIDAALAQAIERWRQGDRLGAEVALEQLLRALPRDDPDRSTVRLARILCVRAAGDREAPDELEAVAGSAASPAADVAGFLAGVVAAEGLRERAEAWPTDQAGLAEFAIGLEALRDARFPAAETALRNAIADAAVAAAWVGALARLADGWLAELASWSTGQARLAEAEPSAALAWLRAARAEAGPFLHAAIDTEIGRWDAREEQRARERRVATQERARARAEADRQAIRHAGERIRTAVTRRAFETIPAELEALEAEVRSKEGKAALALERERAERMRRLHRFLVAQLNARPPRSRIDEVGGRIVRADDQGVTVALVDGGGATPWDRISDRLYFRLVDFYVRTGPLADPERAEMLLAGAIMRHAADPAGSPATLPLEAALALDAEGLEEAARLLPRLPIPGKSARDAK